MSPELQRAYDALQQADEAGNTEDAQQIADYIRELEAQEKQGDMMAPVTGAAVGTLTGAVTGPAVGKAVDIATMKAAEKMAGPKGTPRGDSVAKWLSTQTTGPNVGGATFEEAYKKSEIARGKPVQSRGSQIPMRRGALGITNQPEPPSLPQKAAANIIAGEKLGTPGVARRVAGMGVAGAEAGKMVSDIQQGNTLDAIISGIGAAGGAMSQSRIKPIRALGTGLSLLVPTAQGAGAVKDIVAPSVPEEEKEKKAHGGLVHLAKGGKAMNEALELVKKTLQSGKSGKQLARESEYVHTITPTHQFSQPKKLSIQDLQKQNAVLIGVPGDRSLTGQMVHQVNDVPLTKPVEQFGGPLYGLQQADLGQQNFWASQKGAASGMQNKAARAMQEHDRPVFGIYAAMAPDSSNYALHHIETLLNQVPAMNPAKSQVKQFDKMVREKYPAFAGIMDPDLIEQLKNDSKLRKFIADRMNKTTVADLYGLPSGEATLHAITEPALRDVATGTTGFAVGKLDPFAKLTPSKHPTYSTNIPGEFQGQMIAQLPWDVYFPDVAKKIAANPKQAEHAWGTFKMSEFNQPVTQELVDRIAPIEEVILDLKKKKAAGGSIQEYAKGKRVISAAKDLILPPAENAARTQIIGTLPTYAKAAEILKQRGASGRGIDVGAGLGEGSKILGPNFDTMEPYAKNWKPTFTSAEQMPSDAYGQLTNLNVMNVMPREARDELVQNMGRTMEPGGLGILTTRGADVMKAQGRPGPEPMSIITSRDTYQKGFTKQELEDYLRYMLGDKFDVNKINLGPAGAIIQKKAEGGSTTPAWQRKEGKNPEGGLNAVGRASYNRETGGNLKAPQPEGGSRKKSFCARMGGMKKKLTSSKTANDPDSRINKALRKWKC